MRSNIYTYKEVFDSPGIMFKTEGNGVFLHSTCFNYRKSLLQNVLVSKTTTWFNEDIVKFHGGQIAHGWSRCSPFS